MTKFFLVLLFIPILAVVLIISNRSITSPAQAAGQSWDQLGNSVAGPNKFLGTTNNKDLVFKTNSIEAMSIDTSQNIFIGDGSMTITNEAEGGGSPLISGRRFIPADPPGNLFGFTTIVFSVDTNGNVGASGTVDAAEVRVGLNGYLQLDAQGGVPPAEDCGNQAFEGRMRFDPNPPGEGAAGIMYVCSGTDGWVQSRFSSIP